MMKAPFVPSTLAAFNSPTEESCALRLIESDATRCAGITDFLAAGNLCTSFSTPFSAHTAPSQHAHAACAVPSAINVEYFS
jgi:hypothetical protein